MRPFFDEITFVIIVNFFISSRMKLLVCYLIERILLPTTAFLIRHHIIYLVLDHSEDLPLVIFDDVFARGADISGLLLFGFKMCRP